MAKYLTEKAQPMLKEAEVIQKNHLALNGRVWCFLNLSTLNKANNENIIIIDSNKMYLDWARIAVSGGKWNYDRQSSYFTCFEISPKRINNPAMNPAHWDSPNSQSMRYAVATKVDPQKAGTKRRLQRGTLSGYGAPILGKSKSPSNPAKYPARAIIIFPSGGFPSKKNVLFK